ncbi:MAG: hypothetical protein KF736_12015 [Acidobacteria bacterium]|nr:hypothetical protein [Acidobacteriota bacterium]MCW5948799.1 hypothetical protein [Pyrinomonadaceae bacterium]
MSNKTLETTLKRHFLIEALPEPLSRASSHLQIFDKYIDGTRFRLRQVRDPYTSKWTRLLQQRHPIKLDEHTAVKVAEMVLDDAEYAVFERSTGQEVRINRYFHDLEPYTYEFDVYLGRLWGLNTAAVRFVDVDSMVQFEPPPFAVAEVTNQPEFAAERLANASLDDLREAIGQMHFDHAG